ncbi:hypothetical protein Q7P37_008771 [Cladosporium fusiforme]
MAPKAPTEPVPSKAPAPPPPPPASGPKKPRKNPARRKAERANTATSQAPAAASNARDATSCAALPIKPKTSRQASAPSVLGNDKTAKPTQQSKKPVVKANAAPNSEAASPSSQPKPTTTQQQQQLSTQPQTLRPPPHRSTTTSSLPSTLTLHAPALITGGLIGCAAGAALLMAVHIWYDFAGARAAIATARSARFCIDNLSEEVIGSLQSGTYNTDEALDILRRTTLAYASTLPGGAGTVERVFREVQAVRQSRGEEVDRLLAGAYEELRVVGDRGGGAGGDEGGGFQAFVPAEFAG